MYKFNISLNNLTAAEFSLIQKVITHRSLQSRLKVDMIDSQSPAPKPATTPKTKTKTKKKRSRYMMPNDIITPRAKIKTRISGSQTGRLARMLAEAVGTSMLVHEVKTLAVEELGITPAQAQQRFNALAQKNCFKRIS